MNFVGSLTNTAAAPVRRAAISFPLGAARWALSLLLAAGTVRADELTLERLFSAPDLSGPTACTEP